MFPLDSSREGDRLLGQGVGQDVTLPHVFEVRQVKEDSVLRVEGEEGFRHASRNAEVKP
jgi:hypothetical protein